MPHQLRLVSIPKTFGPQIHDFPEDIFGVGTAVRLSVRSLAHSGRLR
ncbi:MAG: hypothetical protein AAGF98_04975 [Cyanobacteria bacterium P01_H01_bin.153]